MVTIYLPVQFQDQHHVRSTASLSSTPLCTSVDRRGDGPGLPRAQSPLPVDHLRRDQASTLLKALWRAPDRTHQIVARNCVTDRFHNEVVACVDDAIERALACANAGADAFFACAEYETQSSRTAANASGAWGLWLDVDCGEQKATTGAGYSTNDDALAALANFCECTGLSHPTHVVDSGGGLHIYWALSHAVGREQWQLSARQLKRLTEARGFRVDGSRTADIASILRVPGSLNFKYTPPRPVRLLQASAEFIESAALLDAIDRAHRKWCGTSALPAPLRSEVGSRTTPAGSADRQGHCRIDLVRLASALRVLDPDCNDETWKLRRLAPLADAARAQPEFADALVELAKAWSNGTLRGIPSHKWRHAGANGRTGEHVFAEVWRRFLTSDYYGPRTTLGTIFFDAINSGWDGVDGADQFQVVDGNGGADE